MHVWIHKNQLNPFPNESSKLKEFADDNFKVDENGRKFSKWIENTVGKGEIARCEQFLLFPPCFQKVCTADIFKIGLVWERVKNASRLSLEVEKCPVDVQTTFKWQNVSIHVSFWIKIPFHRALIIKKNKFCVFLIPFQMKYTCYRYQLSV